MGSDYLTNPLEFVLRTLVQLYTLAVMLRALLAWVRADFYNPVSQFIVKITNPPLIPLRRLIPSFGRVDTASIVLLAALQMLTIILVGLLQGGVPGLPAILAWSVVELVSLLFNVFIFSILIQAIMSWVNPSPYNPVSTLLYSLNEPILGPVRRIIPPIAGIDLSPLIAILGLQVLKMLVIPPLTYFARLGL